MTRQLERVEIYGTKKRKKKITAMPQARFMRFLDFLSPSLACGKDDQRKIRHPLDRPGLVFFPNVSCLYGPEIFQI